MNSSIQFNHNSDLPSLKSNPKDKLSLLQLALHIIPRFSSPHRNMLYWALFHLLVGFSTLGLALYNESLTLTGFGYIVIFDGFGLMNQLVSQVLINYDDLSGPSASYPYGLKRFEILFTFVNLLYILFAAINMLKEALETILLATGEGVESTTEEILATAYSFGLSNFFGVTLVLICCGVTFASGLIYSNHWQLWLVRFYREQTTRYSRYGNENKKQILNPYNLTTVAMGLSTVFFMFGFHFGVDPTQLDAYLSLIQSGVIFYLTGPPCVTLSMILLQTLPQEISGPINESLMEIHRLPFVIKVESEHFWKTSYGEFIGSLKVTINSNLMDERSAFNLIYSKWENVLDHLILQICTDDSGKDSQGISSNYQAKGTGEGHMHHSHSHSHSHGHHDHHHGHDHDHVHHSHDHNGHGHAHHH